MASIHLSSVSSLPPKKINKQKILVETQEMIEKIQAYQYKMYAQGEHSLLIILQGLDASGKDGVVKHIFSGMNPLGTKANSMKVPTKLESSHDFLWRVHQLVPAHGEVQIFNRSHYEDILVPTIQKTFSPEVIKKRYEHINNFEQLLQDNGTKIVKLYLHISKDKQKQKLNERLLDPTKYWKHNIGDWDTRNDFESYLKVYETIFEKCDNPKWHIIAADKNRYKVYQVSKILLEVFDSMNLKWPKLSPDQETARLRVKAQVEKNKSDEKTKEQQEKLDKKKEKKLAKEQEKLEKKLAKEHNKQKKIITSDKNSPSQAVDKESKN